MKKVCAVATLLFLSFSIFSQKLKYDPFSLFDPLRIDIVRDEYGVPHIFAETDAEVAYGLAWAHAEDDFETIQKCFLASKAMLGQHSGREGALVDYVVHLLRIRELVNERYEQDVSPDYKIVLQGYCAGLNAFAFTHPKEVLEKRAFPITPKDILTYSLLQLAVSSGVDQALKKIYHGTVDLAEWHVEGSNAFAFNSKITEDGNTYLAINTHHPLEGQVAWYEAHLVSDEGWNMLGALFPGSPVIFTGVNESMGWTHTVNHPDKLDIYQLELNPMNRNQYIVDGQWYDLEETTVKLKVKVPGLNLHVKRKVYWSIYGPTLVTDKGAFSIRTAAIMDIRAMEQWYRMNKSHSFHDFRRALEMHAIPGYNIMYADRYDTIYYVSNAKLPVRDPAYDWQGTLPGNTMKTLWTSIHPFSDLPQLLNPASGYLYNTNHSPFKATADGDNLNADSYDAMMGYETIDNNRSLRVQELMRNLQKITYDDFRRIKYDLQLPQSLAFPVNIDSLFLLSEKEFPQYTDLIKTLKTWNRRGDIESRGAALFAIFFYHIAEKYQQDPSLKVLTKAMTIDAYSYMNSYLLNNFGTTNITLGDYQKLERGDRSEPLPGLPDVLAAMYSSPTENGRVKGTLGECYISLVRFTKDGPEIETVSAYGASNRFDSKHYSDQMDLFLAQKTKKMTLDREAIYKSAERIYHPDAFFRVPLSGRLSRNRR